MPRTPKRAKKRAARSEETAQGIFAIAEEAVQELLNRQKSEEAFSNLEIQSELREKFFSLVSHDLRSPLTVIKSSAQFISAHPDRPDLTRALSGRIVDAVNRAERMIRDVLDANRIRAGIPLSIEPREADLHKALNELVLDFRVTYPDKCRYEGSPGLNGVWDISALRRAVENLITNAVKYGADKPVMVSASADGDHAQIAVHNFGNQIPQTEWETLFQWHARSDTAKKSGQTGWGLGLMIVKAVAEAHGGRVTITSTQHEGTTFTIIVPRSGPSRSS